MIVRRLLVLSASLSLLLFLSTPIQAAEVEVDASGQEQKALKVDEALVFQLIENSGADTFRIDIKTATGIAEVIQAAKADSETHSMVAHMRTQEEYKEYSRSLTPDMIVSALSEALREIRSAETLFEMRTPAQAVEDMIQDGLIPEHRIAEYKQNPDLLIDDTRKHLYFTFVSLAAAGGYL